MASADAATASWVSTTPFGVAGRAARRDHERIAGSTSSPTPIAAHDRLLGRGGQPLIDRERGVAGVPDPLQPLDELGSARQIERDELAGHRFRP